MILTAIVHLETNTMFSEEVVQRTRRFVELVQMLEDSLHH